jgi:hypothetical protein
MPPELRRLMLRYNQLGRLLPQDPELLDFPEDIAGLAEVRIVLAEMAAVKGEIDTFLAAARREREAAGR